MIKDLVLGLGEIGTPILKILSKKQIVVGFDINPNLMNLQKFNKFKDVPTNFLHICVPFSRSFEKIVLDVEKKFHPKVIVIHSTIKPGTTEKLQKKLQIPIIYSATRGVHKRMLNDLKKYTKFYAIEKSAPREKWASLEFSKRMKTCNIKTKKMSKPITLELAKILVDTSYYGWLINFAQLSNMIAKKNKVDYDEMWSFSDEIHDILGNRPKMFPGFIGGHCVIPNLLLIKNKKLNMINEINNYYFSIVKDSKSIEKKYSKLKK